MTAVEWSTSFADLMVKTGRNITLVRALAGVYDSKGRYNAATTTESTIQANVQPVNGIELQDLPEGRRGYETIKMYTSTALRTVTEASGLPADQVVVDSKTYQVDVMWNRHAHYKALCTRIER